MRIHKNVFELIGNTPLVELTNYENNHGLDAGIIAKVEYFEPAGSIKDRIAKAMIDEAEANGLLDADTVIIEPTSGNTGIGLAAIAAARGSRIIIVMPDTMSVERRQAHARLWCRARAHAWCRRHEGRNRKGGGACERISQFAHPVSVHQPGQPGDSLSHDGARDLARH